MCIDKQYSEEGPKSAQICFCLKALTCICAENGWQWVWFSSCWSCWILPLSSLGTGCLAGSCWIAKDFAHMKRKRRASASCTICLLRCFVPKRRPWDSVGAQLFAAVSNVSAGQNVSRMCTCTQNAPLQPFIFKLCLKTLWSPWIFYHHRQESILHLHFCAGTYTFKTVHVSLIACVLYGPDRKPHKNDRWILCGFHGYRIKPVLSSHSSIPPNFVSNEKICSR